MNQYLNQNSLSRNHHKELKEKFDKVSKQIPNFDEMS